MDDGWPDWEQVAETSQIYEAELMAMRLREAGFDVQILDQTFRQEPLPNVRSFSRVRVMVPSGRLADARRVLAESVPLPEDAEPPWGADSDTLTGPDEE